MLRLQRLHAHLSVHSCARPVTSKTAVVEEKVVPLLAKVCTEQDLSPTAHLKTLEAADIAYFKANGLLIKTGLLDAQKLIRARSEIWDAIEGRMGRVPDCPEEHQHSPSPGIRRDDPSTWLDASVNHDKKHGGGLRSLGHLDWMVDLVPNDTHLVPGLLTRGGGGRPGAPFWPDHSIGFSPTSHWFCM